MYVALAATSGLHFYPLVMSSYCLFASISSTVLL